MVFNGLTKSTWMEPARRLYDHELVVVTHGACTITVDGRALHCRRGNFIIIPPDTLHATVQESPSLYRYCIHFDWAGSDQPMPAGVAVFCPSSIKREFVHRAPPSVPKELLYGRIASLPQAVELLSAIALKCESRDSGERASCRGLLLSLLLMLLTPTSGQVERPQQSLASKIRTLLHHPLPQRYSVQKSLESLGYSYAHLCRLFHKTYGISPLQYLNALRIERAKRLLSNQRLSVAEVARKAGINNPHYFARMFRRYTGQSPSAFRQGQGARIGRAA